MKDARVNTADYIADMAGELAELATRSGLNDAAYMLELAAAQARDKKRARASDRSATQ